MVYHCITPAGEATDLCNLRRPGRDFFLSNGGRRAERRRKRGCGLLRMEPLSISTDAFCGVHGRIGRFCGRPWSCIWSKCMVCHRSTPAGEATDLCNLRRPGGILVFGRDKH